MSNRRKSTWERRQQRPAPRPPQPRASSNPMAGMEPWIWAMQDADEAERRGDAKGALDVVRRRPLDLYGDPFWRPSRVERLQQLVLLAPFIPGWAVSRWILAQALQQISDQDRGPSSRVSRAAGIAIDLRGGLAMIRGVDTIDKQVTVMDHDWVFRQLHLFDLGGLAAFLDEAAAPDLIAGADRIRDWARTPMGGFDFVGASQASLLWYDHESRTSFTTPNIGSAAHLSPGDTVIGRLVPLSDGVIFESPPLRVPRAVALDVAADPARWVDVLRESGLVRSGEIHTGSCDESGLLSDIPTGLTTMTLTYHPDPVRLVAHADTAERARAALDLARSSFVEDDDRQRHLEEGCPREGPGDLDADADADVECALCVDDGWEAWSRVHAALVDTDVVAALPDVVGPADLPLLRDIAGSVAEPASSWVVWLIGQVEAAA